MLKGPLSRIAPRLYVMSLAQVLLVVTGTTWQLVFASPRPSPALPAGEPFVALLLVLVGIGAMMLARSIARALARLSETVRAFGAGELAARAHLDRADELGEVAEAFDHMADRVSHALKTDKTLLVDVAHALRSLSQQIHLAMELAFEADTNVAQEARTEIAANLAALDRIVEKVLATTTRDSFSDGAAPPMSGAAPPIQVTPVDLRAVIRKSATRFRLEHPHREVRLRMATDLPAVKADPALFQRVIDNLLDNADKYTADPKADITVLVLSSATKLLVEVRDRGEGIATQDLARVFEPVFCAARRRAGGSGGLGLGLALARRIVEAHAGTLRVDSVVGRGTTVRIEMPI